jgi:hypothetical protein
MLPPRRTDYGRDLSRDTVRTLMGRPAAIAQAGPSGFIEAGEPFVAGLATDAEPRAQFRPGVQIQPVIANEPLTLFHGSSALS